MKMTFRSFSELQSKNMVPFYLFSHCHYRRIAPEDQQKSEGETRQRGYNGVVAVVIVAGAAAGRRWGVPS